MFRNNRIKVVNVYDGKMTPHKVIGNVFFVGTYQASSHIIDTGDGLIMIDTGYQKTFYLVLHSLYQLGYKPTDVKYIINTHWHIDHAEATGLMVDLSGAKTLIGREDAARVVERGYFTPDILIKDGDTLELGNTRITFMETPGHTKGTISFFFDVTDGGKVYRCGSFGGAGVNTMEKNKLDFPEGREAYRTSLNRLRMESVDVMIGNHTWNNNGYEYGRLILETGENRFIDPTLWHRFLDNCEARLDAVIERERQEDKEG